MFKDVCRKMKSNSQSAEIFRISSAFGLWKSSKSFANLIAFLICIFFSANTRAQTIPIPNITLTNTPICGENANLTASLPGGAAVPTDFVYQWFSDADCTLEITDGRSGSYNENLTLPISSTTTVYCRLRKTTTETETRNFSYTGAPQTYSVPTGYTSFTFQVWGAQGGSTSNNTGGKGGYSIGTLSATSGISSIYVYVGGTGSASTGGIANGGWNGGGTSWATNGTDPASGGGGGTDIRVNGNSLYHRIIVAGGGGGGGEDPGDHAGYGGGETGSNGTGANTNVNGGGTQTGSSYGAVFGQGAHTRCDGGAGGGGWYGGGVYNGISNVPTSNDACDAGGGSGGSGYVYTSSTAGNYPSGCRLNSSLYLTSAQTIAGNTSFIAPNGSNETGHSGNGYARITTTYYPTGTAGAISLSCYEPGALPSCIPLCGTNVIYCSTSGNDTNIGTSTQPVSSISRALTLAQTDGNPSIIRMASGDYPTSSTVDLIDNVIIDGGWNANTSTGVWTKGTGETTLTGTFGTVTSGSSGNAAIHRIAIRSEGKQNWKLQDLSVNVTGYGSSDCHSDSKKGNSVYGLYMTNTSDGDELIRVNIKVGAGGAAVQKGTDGRANPGYNGGSYRTAGGARGLGIMQGKAGGSGGAAGTNGSNGKGNGTSGTAGDGTTSTYGTGGTGGTATYSWYGTNPGGNGSDGINGTNGSGLKNDFTSNTFNTYFIPGRGKSGNDGTGGAGGGGGGGSCGCGGTLGGGAAYTGGTGGGGGGGGVGGHGGTGGAGGGGSFGIYCYNLSSLPIMQDVKITKGNAGSGASGQKGQQGGAGGAGGAGTRNSNATGNNCNNDDNHKGGNGGDGGDGGNGADGGKGPDGEAYKIVVVPTSGSATKTNDGYSDDLPSAVLTSIDYGISSKKGCTNSQIALTRSDGSWSGQYGTLVNDVTESSSSYSTDNESIIVGYSALGSFAPTSDGRKVFITQERNIGEIDGTDEFDAGESGNYLYDESLSSGDIMYWSLVSEDGATQYSTAVSVYDGTDGNTFSVNSTVLGLTPGDYYIKLEVDNNCCGMSVPIWKSITVKEPSLLPIELTSFSAECDGKSSLVEWTTATERNNDHFVLERSSDAINFAKIARVAGVGNSIEPLDYSYTDYDIRNGDNYYRLWQVDYDGTRTASEIIVATCVNETIDAPEVLAYPNPFSGELTVVLDNFGNRAATIEVYDMLGCIVKAVDIDSSSQTNAILNLSNLPNAAYNIRVRTKDFVINKQVIKN